MLGGDLDGERLEDPDRAAARVIITVVPISFDGTE
jgi:hypothetical protein